MEEGTTLCDFFILVLCEGNVFFVIMVHGVWKSWCIIVVVPYPALGD